MAMVTIMVTVMATVIIMVITTIGTTGASIGMLRYVAAGGAVVGGGMAKVPAGAGHRVATSGYVARRLS
jgi:hypothetical protein